MRVVVLGGTGNVGFALTRALADEPQIDEVVGVARRVPDADVRGTTDWRAVDIATDDLVPLLRGADAVVHLAWLIQPGRDLEKLWAVNVDGTDRVLRAVAAAGVGTLVYASSIGAYSPAHDERPVDESFPTHGIATSSYSRQKAYVERLLDTFEAEHRGTRVVRLRPGLIFSRDAAEEQRRFFLGMLVPRALLRPGVLPVFPHLPAVRFQAVHSDDVADAYRRAVLSDVRGAFNVAADPILSTRDVADVLGARPVPVPRLLARWGAAGTWRLRLHPVEPGWVDLGVRSPVMDTTRARTELGWTPAHDARDALRAVLGGIADGTGAPTPTLAPGRRPGEVGTRHGARYSTDPRAEAPDR
ncbi:MAG: NAD-dependent epimerase/dehydratase family protein [Actinobacteria bacterium]|nr:NAD-dependent epimerase/dehydratase family protein [Actinomycetota bacterium]